MVQREEFARWWIETEPKLLKVAMHYSRSSDTAEEVVQDIAVLALGNLSRFATAGDFRRWAYVKIYWLVLDAYRGLKEQSLERTTEKAVPPTQEQELILQDIKRLIPKLPSRQQAVILGMLEGKSTETIARGLQVTEATVRSLRRFARNRLVTLLEREGG